MTTTYQVSDGETIIAVEVRTLTMRQFQEMNTGEHVHELSYWVENVLASISVGGITYDPLDVPIDYIAAAFNGWLAVGEGVSRFSRV